MKFNKPKNFNTAFGTGETTLVLNAIKNPKIGLNSAEIKNRVEAYAVDEPSYNIDDISLNANELYGLQQKGFKSFEMVSNNASDLKSVMPECDNKITKFFGLIMIANFEKEFLKGSLNFSITLGNHSEVFDIYRTDITCGYQAVEGGRFGIVWLPTYNSIKIKPSNPITKNSVNYEKLSSMEYHTPDITTLNDPKGVKNFQISIAEVSNTVSLNIYPLIGRNGCLGVSRLMDIINEYELLGTRLTCPGNLLYDNLVNINNM